jgi:hypothetical protein
LVRTIIDGLKSRATEAIIVAIIAVGVTAFWTSWDYLEGVAKGFVIETTVEELSKNQNRLVDPIQKVLTDLRSTEIGALSAGNFVLTPANNQYVLPIYMPENHAGRLSVLLSGSFVPKQSYVVLMLPNGKKLEIENSETTIDLAEYLRIEGAAATGLPDALVVKPAHIKGLRALTFQMAGPKAVPDAEAAADGIRTEQAIFVRYLAMISPTLRMGSAE